MGQQQTKIYNLPSGKNFKNSYCKHSQLTRNFEIYDSINLENLVDDYPGVNDVFNYKLMHLGYSYKTKYYFVPNPLNKIIDSIILPKDIKVKSKCYLVSEIIIKSLISQGNILIAGIVMDNDFLMSILKVSNNQSLSDIVLVTGYTSHSFIIKTKWMSETIEIPWDYLGYIQEIWNIYLESPEEKYINEIKNE